MGLQPDAGQRVAILCGLPGSGKTTVARALEAQWGATRFCADDWMDLLGIDLRDQNARQRIEALQWSIAQKLLRRGESAIFEWGSWTRDERDTIRTFARAVGATVSLYFLDPDIPVLLERLAKRGREHPPIGPDELRSWSGMIERPDTAEQALYDHFVRRTGAPPSVEGV